MFKRTIGTMAVLALSAAPLAAQGRGRNVDGVPPGHRPPAGLCRIWIDGVPPGQQPGVTNCAYAYAHVPANGRVLNGGAPRRNRWVRPDDEHYYGDYWTTRRATVQGKSAATVRGKGYVNGKGKWKAKGGKGKGGKHR